ncbi:MAG: hypothetical protein KKA10_09900 [Euryarchaeota archaeon]|nr:hypothetical protein [Euryarchaeota archaeon]
MNWIEKIFGKKEQEPLEIRFEELTGWLGSGEKRFSAGGHAASIFLDIEVALDRIRKRASELANEKPEGRFHLKIVKIATSNRDNMVKQVSLLIDNINIPKKTDVKSVLEFHENGMQTLNMCLENMMKSYQYTKMVFFEDSKKVIAEVNELRRLFNRLGEPMNDNKMALEAFENAQSHIQIIKEMTSQIDAEKKTIKDFDEKIDTLQKKIELNQNSLEQLADSEQWKYYVNCKNDLADLDKKYKKALSDINILFVPLKKPLLRLKQLNDDGKFEMAPGIKKELNLCLSDPASVSPGFFVELRDILKNDTVTFNPDKRDVILENIMYAGANIGVFQKEYQTNLSNFNAKKEEISGLNIVQEAASLESRISSLHDESVSAEKKLEVSKRHLLSLEEGLVLKKQELQEIVSGIDKRKKVLF